MVTPDLYGAWADYAWNMGWMHDMLSYMEKDLIFRRYHQSQITSMIMLSAKTSSCSSATTRSFT